MKKLSFFKYPKLIGAVMSSINTDMSLGEILDYGYWFYINSDVDIEKFQIPTTQLSEGVLINKEIGWVLKMDELKNIEKIRDIVFGD